MKFIEIMGFPGSGKSTFKKKFNFESKIFTLEYIFFKKVFIDERGINVFFFTILFYIFEKKFYDFVFNSYINKKSKYLNFIFKKIKIGEKELKNRNKKIINNYKKLVDISSISKKRKNRVIARFNYFASMYYYVLKHYDHKGIKILQDEGFYQKIFLNYNYDKKLTYILINKYLKSIPKIGKVIFIDEKLDTCINRLKKRKNYFMYQNNNKEKNIFPEIKKLLNLDKHNLFIVLNKNKIKNSKKIIEQINNL